ncbi:glycoside hydrolase domain-containing protein, partial [Verrucomicrobiota bacterium]
MRKWPQSCLGSIMLLCGLTAWGAIAQPAEVLFERDFEAPDAGNFWDAGQGRIVQDETADNGTRVAAAVGSGAGTCLMSAYVRQPHFTIGNNTWIGFDYYLEEQAQFRLQLSDRGLTPEGEGKGNVLWRVAPQAGKWVHVEIPATELQSMRGAKAGPGDTIWEINFFMDDGVTGNPGLRIDNIRVEERPLVGSWAETVSAEGGIAVWAVPEGYKIDKFGKRILVLDRNQRIDALRDRNVIWDAEEELITLAGARGETLALQFIIEGGTTGLNAVDVAVGDLTGADGALIPASRIELFKVYYTRLKGKGSGPTNRPSMGEGWYPDALVPWEVGDTAAYGGYDGPPFAVASNEVQAVWADLTIPYGTPAGTYTGTVTVTAADATSSALKVSLQVYAFDIPREIHNLLFMNFGIDDLNQAGGYWMSGDTLMCYEDEVYRISRRHRFTAGNMYSRSRPAIEETTNGLVSVDWSAYDARWDKVLNPTNNVFGPGEAPIEIWRVPLSSPVWGNWPVNEKAWDQMIVEIKRHWQERGWDLSKAYAYLADE